MDRYHRACLEPGGARHGPRDDHQQALADYHRLVADSSCGKDSGRTGRLHFELTVRWARPGSSIWRGEASRICRRHHPPAGQNSWARMIVLRGRSPH